jgi:hypothetical protein
MTDLLTQIESALSADAQKASSFLVTLQQDVASVLSKIAQGAELIYEDAVAVVNWVNTHLSIVDGIIDAFEGAAATLPASTATTAVQKLLTDTNTAVNDAAAVSTALATGSAAGQPVAVQTVTTLINSVNTISNLANQASAAITSAASATAAATTAAATTATPAAS